MPLLKHSWVLPRAVARTLAGCLSVQLLERVMGQSSDSILSPPDPTMSSNLSPLLLQPERWLQPPRLSTGVSWDWLQAAIATTHPNLPPHLFKTHTNPHTHRSSLVLAQPAPGETHWKSVRVFTPPLSFCLSLSLRGLLLPTRNAAYLKQSHDFTGSQNDPRGLLSGEREREREGHRERDCRIV